jgi:hypothetical protein
MRRKAYIFESLSVVGCLEKEYVTSKNRSYNGSDAVECLRDVDTHLSIARWTTD